MNNKNKLISKIIIDILTVIILYPISIWLSCKININKDIIFIILACTMITIETLYDNKYC